MPTAIGAPYSRSTGEVSSSLQQPSEVPTTVSKKVHQVSPVNLIRLSLLMLQAPMINTVAHPDRAPGLGDSRWAGRSSLSSLSGLRPHPPSTPTWDNSNGYTASKVPGLSLNELPRFAWNNGVKPNPKPTKDISASRDKVPLPEEQVRSPTFQLSHPLSLYPTCPTSDASIR